MNSLYFGDNLHILHDHIKSESVNLIYLDPPFNSKRDYSVYLSTPKGHQSDAQITAFEDTWHWGDQAEQEYSDLLRQANTDVSSLITALRAFLHESDMMAYLVMMTTRLLELHRVLKPTGSLYLHCDPTASHYLKIVLDNVFGAVNFRSEISWKRSSAHNDAKQGRKQFGNVRDVIFFYTKSDDWTWNWVYTPYDQSYIDKNYRLVEEETGRVFRLGDLTAAKPGGDVSYEFMGTTPYKGRYWAYSRANMEKYYQEGRLYFPKNGGTPSYKRYLDEMPGVALQNDWNDINSPQGNESLGYPTQKPIALLERIIQASSNPGDVVLDPFCGCGTAVHAAQKLGRQWIGIDITHLAIHLIERRLKDAFPGVEFETHGQPEDLESARDLALRDKYEFQFWACSLVGAQPYKGGKKGADGGTDGIIYFQDEKTGAKKIIVSVKGGEHVTRTMIADLKNTVDREHAQIGLFVCLEKPTDPMRTEALSAGYYVNPWGEQFPKIQIMTIAELMDDRQPQYRDFSAGTATHKKAKTEKGPGDQPALFGG